MEIANGGLSAGVTSINSLTGAVTLAAGSGITITPLANTLTIASTGGGSGTVTSVASADGSITVTNPTTTVDLAVVKSPKLTTARTIGGVSFDGTANTTVASATGGFTVSGGDLLLGTNHLRIGTADGTAFVDIQGATTLAQGFRIEGNTTAALSFTTFVTGDSNLRFSFLSGGQLNWGSGALSSDTNLYRSAVATLKTDGNLIVVGSLGATGTRVVKGWFTDLEVTNAVVGSITGNAATATAVAVGGITGLGTGVVTALAVNIGSAGAFVTFNGALGTPSSGTVTNLTGTASININGTVGATTPAAGTFTAAIANSFVPNANTVPSNGMYLPASNTLGWGINSSIEMQLTSTALSPGADGGSSLGTTALGWQNIFANTGFVLNIENSDWVATHTAGILTVGTGDLRITNAGTNTASVVTVGGTQTLTNKTLTSPILTTPSAFTMGGNITTAENTGIILDPALSLSADGKYIGTEIITGTGGATIAFGDLVTLDKDDSRWELVDISVAAAATGDARGIMGIAITSSTDGNPITVLMKGYIRADANFPALTIGAAVYASTTGDIVVTQPSTVDYVIRIIGHAVTADSIRFCPENDWITHT